MEPRDGMRRAQWKRRRLLRGALLALVAFLVVVAPSPVWPGAGGPGGVWPGTGGPGALQACTAWGGREARAQGLAGQPTAFTFVHIADPHMGSAAGNRATPQVVGEIAALPERPAFVVVGGDLTELGGRDQYDVYDATLAPLGLPVYSTPGNHESRWLDAGKGQFVTRYGPRYYDFAYEGIHFAVLDTSVSNQTHGHFEPAMLDWLRRRLAAWGKEAPVVVFMHHPVGYPGQRFLDNEQDFLETVEGYRVVAVFTGHGHIHAAWRRNGIPFFMTKAAMEGGYTIVRVAEGALTVWTKTVGQEAVLAAAVPLDAPAAPSASLRILGPQPGSRWKGDFTLRVRLSPPEATVEYRMDGGTWVPLGDPGQGVRTTTVPIAGLAPGFHDLTVRAAVGGDVWTREVRVCLEPPAPTAGTATRAVSLAWRYRTGGGVQSTPLIDGARGFVYFGSNDGVLRCVRLADGKLRWQVGTGGLLLGAPCLVGATLYFGSSDGLLRAVDVLSGRVKWEFATGGPVVASPLCVRNTVYFGDGEGVFHAVDASTGAERWRFPTGGLIRAGATWGRGTVYFGSWDGHVYALDAASGRLVWKRNLARQIYYAPSGGAPLYYLDKVYVTTPADPHAGRLGVHALDAATGEIVWQSTVPGGLSSPVVQNLGVLVNTAGGRVTALHPLSGEVWWELPTDLTVYDSPAVPYGGDTVLGGLWGEVVACNGWTGQEVWRYRLGFRLLAARAAAGHGYVLVPSMDGYLYALKVAPSPRPSAEAPFTDVSRHWARESVAAVARLGLMQGYGDGSFLPAAPITRAELATVLARYLVATGPGEGYVTRFADVGEHWARPHILALEQRGFVQGEPASDGTVKFRPDDPVTRAELAALLARIRGATAPSPGFTSRFADVGSSWARDYIAAMEEEGLLKGTSQGKKYLFRPLAPATRAEVATILSRLAEGP
ncbi:MAG: PQQ-binding-like beta-propeller repeat protein [Bacillota bacterium]|nr:PQQ-binding-like beta-propeller repeat protein [Bacillota bacterium]